MKIKIKIFLVLVVLVLVIGCSPLGGKTDQTPITELDIYKGTKGLEAKFLENAPPKEAYEQSPLKVGFLLKNEGATDITKGYIALAVEKALIELIDATPTMTFTLPGKNIVKPEGEQNTYFFKIKTKNITKQAEQMTSTILATFCYRYTTKANPNVCVDTDIYDLRPGEDACRIEDVNLDSQGAPVAVTKIESEMLPYGDTQIRPMFTIHVSNKGNGRVIRSEKVAAACQSTGITPQDYNTFDYEVRLGGEEGIALECSPDKFRLKRDADFIRCSVKPDDAYSTEQYSFITPLYIKLDYGYAFTLSQSTEIKRRTKVP